MSTYQKKADRIWAAADLKEPDHVPVICSFQFWAPGYANSTLIACDESEEEEYRVFDKTLNDFYWDGIGRYGLTRNMPLYDLLGFNFDEYSADGTAYTNNTRSFFEPQDYEAFLADPMDFLQNVVNLRKYPVLSGSREEMKDTLRKALRLHYNYSQRNIRRYEHLKNVTGIPTMWSPNSIMPGIDWFFSYIRSINGLGDIRRKPEQVLGACQFFYHTFAKNAVMNAKDATGVFAFAPALYPTFLSAKQFEKFVWNDYREMITTWHEKGGKTLLVMEGSWRHLFDFVRELPKGSVVCHVERDDIVETKKLLGDKFAIMGGIDLQMLKAETPEKCIDHVKGVIDACAPGGGYIFSQNSCAIHFSDAKPENVRAVNEFVRDYGKY